MDIGDYSSDSWSRVEILKMLTGNGSADSLIRWKNSSGCHSHVAMTATGPNVSSGGHIFCSLQQLNRLSFVLLSQFVDFVHESLARHFTDVRIERLDHRYEKRILDG